MRVVIADDSIIVREGLRRILIEEGHSVEEVLSRGDAVPAIVAATRPDVVILDVRMPPSYTDEGIQVATALRASSLSPAVLVLSQHPVPEYATRLLDLGTGVGYLLKDRILQPEQLTNAMTRLAAGGTVVDPDVVGELLLARRRDDPLDRLSARERDVLRLMAEGLTDKGIADRLYVTVNTVGTHVQRIFRSLDLPRTATDNRRVLAVLVFLQSR